MDTLCTSGLTDDVMFPHNKPASKTTRMFRLIRHIKAPVGRCRKVAAPGTKSAVFDGIFLKLHWTSNNCRAKGLQINRITHMKWLLTVLKSAA